MSLTQDLSIYIPRVDTRSLPPIVTNGCQFIGATGEFEDNLKDYMAKTFHYNNIGDVDRIDLIPKETPQGHTYFIAFVHFKEWQDTVQARQLQKDINDPQVKAKIHFNESWYWICSKNNTTNSRLLWLHKMRPLRLFKPSSTSSRWPQILTMVR
jgi:hypothetical protein